MVQRTLTVKEIEDQWDTVVNTVESPTDAVIVEADGKPKVVVITYDRFMQALDLERDREYRLADARRRFEALAASIGDRNSDLPSEMIQEMADRDWDEPAAS
jgi:PHD/YefM family antitoxin component YafN of YafNO toxin-antitoxin module